MFSDSYIVPECLVRPGSFGGLMALYESNFIKLSHLIGTPNLDCETYISTSTKDCALHLGIDACSRYTREFRLTYLFEDPDGLVAEPDLLVKVYLDARMTDVMGWADWQRHTVLAGLAQRFSRELDRRWSCNMMLSKWLDYLLDMNHGFRPVSSRSAALADA
jgi:hypothetical protein